MMKRTSIWFLGSHSVVDVGGPSLQATPGLYAAGLIHQIRFSGEAEVDRCVYEPTLAEAASSWLAGPFSKAFVRLASPIIAVSQCDLRAAVAHSVAVAGCRKAY